MYSTFDLEFTDMFSPILAKLSKDVVFRINKEVLEQTWYPSVVLFQSENVHCQQICVPQFVSFAFRYHSINLLCLTD